MCSGVGSQDPVGSAGTEWPTTENKANTGLSGSWVESSHRFTGHTSYRATSKAIQFADLTIILPGPPLFLLQICAISQPKNRTK